MNLIHYILFLPPTFLFGYYIKRKLSQLFPNQNLDKWHCLPLISVDKDAKTLELLSKRFNTTSVHSYQEIISKFKGLVGIRL